MKVMNSLISLSRFQLCYEESFLCLVRGNLGELVSFSTQNSIDNELTSQIQKVSKIDASHALVPIIPLVAGERSQPILQIWLGKEVYSEAFWDHDRTCRVIPYVIDYQMLKTVLYDIISIPMRDESPRCTLAILFRKNCDGTNLNRVILPQLDPADCVLRISVNLSILYISSTTHDYYLNTGIECTNSAFYQVCYHLLREAFVDLDFMFVLSAGLS